MRALVFFALAVVLPAPVSAQSVEAPALTLKDLRGRTVRLEKYKGKVVLLNYWATWCPPCRAEVPDLVRWQHEYSGAGLQIIGVTQAPRDRVTVRRFVRRAKVNYPVVFDAAGSRRRFASSETLPMTVIIDRAGGVRGVIEGIFLPEEFERHVKPLLR